MKVIRKINNNVAECEDSKGRRLIAFGKGIGFQKVPYELKDLSEIKMTFYKLESHFEKLITEIPEDILTVSSEIVMYAQNKLQGKLNATLVFSLADHIRFAIQRYEKGLDIYSYSDELVHFYPKEMKIARESLKYVNKKLKVKLPVSEISNIAMHLINAEQETQVQKENQFFEEIIDEIMIMIKKDLNITFRMDDYSFVRFKNHCRYFLKRLHEKQDTTFEHEEKMWNELKNKNKEIYQLNEKICKFVYKKVKIDISRSEKIYLMIHLNRLNEVHKEK